MNDVTEKAERPERINLPLAPSTRRQLQAVAGELHISEADTIRIAVARLIAQRQQLLGVAA